MLSRQILLKQQALVDINNMCCCHGCDLKVSILLCTGSVHEWGWGGGAPSCWHVGMC
jgi:hypothetical protein